MIKKLTNEEVDRRLIGRKIKRISGCKNSRDPVSFQCEVEGCLYIWKAKFNHINNGGGCPNCVNRAKRLTNEEVDRRLTGRNIKKISEYKNSSDPMDFQCEICYYTWKARFGDVNGGTGCPKCINYIRLTNEEVDKRLMDRNIKRMGEYKNSHSSLDFQCEYCLYIWTAAFRDIDHKKSGCPKCSGHIRLTNEEIDRRLIGRNIKRVSNFVHSGEFLDFQCEDCFHIWSAKIGNIDSRKSGCPKCALGKNEKLVGSILQENKIELETQKLLRTIIATQNKIRLDYYLPQINTIIEYNGRQHYEPVCFGGQSKEDAKLSFANQQARDQYLQTFCDQYNMTIIWIDGRKYKGEKLKAYVLDILIPQLKARMIEKDPA